jgi:hypothetical protein
MNKVVYIATLTEDTNVYSVGIISTLAMYDRYNLYDYILNAKGYYFSTLLRDFNNDDDILSTIFHADGVVNSNISLKLTKTILLI